MGKPRAAGGLKISRLCVTSRQHNDAASDVLGAKNRHPDTRAHRVPENYFLKRKKHSQHAVGVTRQRALQQARKRARQRAPTPARQRAQQRERGRPSRAGTRRAETSTGEPPKENGTFPIVMEPTAIENVRNSVEPAVPPRKLRGSLLEMACSQPAMLQAPSRPRPSHRLRPGEGRARPTQPGVANSRCCRARSRARSLKNYNKH